MNAGAVPIINIGPFLAGTTEGRRDVARQVDEACTEFGFFAITGHGVPSEPIARLRAAAHEFFELDVAEKLRAVHPVPGMPRGYRVLAGESVGRTSGADAPPDLKEYYHMGRDRWPEDNYHAGEEGKRYFIANLWPERPAGLEDAAMAHYRNMEALDGELMKIAACALDLPDDFFADKIDRHVSAMRLNYYPPQTADPEPGQLRCGVHTDYGLFTLLLGEGGVGGLQVRTRKGDWVDVVTQPEFFVVNIGDLLMRWTNDRWISNPHRVTNPDPGPARSEGRLSIPFFHQPNYDALIECIPSCAGPGNPARYAPVRSGDYRDGKYAEARLVANG
ncbi:MAG TPA: 2-oxoglutarate and iron-dependent oxygenase domain-containing protein [Rhodospirillales bacterium]|jgi:isopenicillin N synthase-like dioxygenase|nr:2-oxoglutarate and iron-dependent oxygenase domain-containing protein [Rhodospirillales bacterium]